jgi:hypothetical protein
MSRKKNPGVLYGRVLKWNECHFEIFSNIKLIVLNNTSRCHLYGTTNEKILSRLVRLRKDGKVGGDRSNIASCENKR